jgi:hypothetical protein
MGTLAAQTEDIDADLESAGCPKGGEHLKTGI